MRQVYELSGDLTEANKDAPVQFTLSNDVDKIEGPATLNVVRVRCPSQFICTGAGTVQAAGGDVVQVEPYSSPSEAIQNYQKAMRLSAISTTGTTSSTDPATASNCFRVFTLDHTGAATVTFSFDGQSYRTRVEGSGVVAFAPFPEHDTSARVEIVPDFGPSVTATASNGTLSVKEFRTFSKLPTLSLEGGVLKLETDLDFTFDDVAANRLNLGRKVGQGGEVVRIGTKSPSFNDVRRIVMTLTPTTQRVIAMDASSTNKLYDNASISFTVDDDPSDNSPMSMYSILSDFNTNSLRIEGGTTESMSVLLQRCVFDPTTGVLGKPEGLDLPQTHNFVEVKLVADADEPTAKRQRLPSQQPLIPPKMQRLPGVPTPEGG